MGGKRIPLGAYIIYLFQQCGFELLDNIIWDKGEPQTSRHLNDGKFVPFYQRPANCYEHMFIFKKKGSPLRLNINKNMNDNIWSTNVQKIIPVFKIGRGGLNRYGHTAPYPKDIPKFSILCFTNEKEIALDPYAGSFTSGLIAHQLGRFGVGIEINDDYCNLAIKKAQDSNISVEIWQSEMQKPIHI
ncbi:MAG: DNA methyltransferase [Candidatus Hodarchaeales archaeon]|jgi:DNA modification methylase